MSEIIGDRRYDDRQLAPEHAALFVGAAIFLTILAPFGTDADLSVPLRFLYWSGVIIGGTVIALTFSGLFQRHTRARTAFGFVLVMAVQVSTASIPITMLVGGMEMLLREPISWAQLPQVYPYVLSIAAVITAASMFVRRYKELRNQIAENNIRSKAQTSAKEPQASTRFHLRLGPHMRHEPITMLRAEDHNLCVCTPNGTEVIRCNISTAIDELDTLDGRRVHRSFWVARSEIQSVNRHGNAYRLILKDGRTVPLSRRRHRELSDCGWLPI